MFPRVQHDRSVSMLSLIALIVAIPIVLSACRDDTEVGRERQEVPDASPTTLAALPEGIEAVDVVIADGQFQVGEIVLQENQPTVMRVDNQDDRDYRLRIGRIVPETAIPAGEETMVNFTTPQAERYTGELLAADEDEVLATVLVLVQAPGRTSP